MYQYMDIVSWKKRCRIHYNCTIKHKAPEQDTTTESGGGGLSMYMHTQSKCKTKEEQKKRTIPDNHDR